MSAAPLTVGSLCSGIGGLDLGLQSAGMRVVWQAEVDPFRSQVLARHWPDVPNHGDITTIDWSTVERPDVIVGGYPCQPFSLNGKRRGAADERHLWPFVRDAVRVLGPRWVLLENVRGHLTLGFDRVLADLAALGFDAEWSLVSACSVGAAHTRERVFIVAHPRPWEGVHGQREGIQLAESGDPPGDVHPIGVEPEPCRVDHGAPDLVDRLAAIGDSVVPQVAELIGRLVVVADRDAGEVSS